MLTEQNIITKMENSQYAQIISSVKELRIIKHDLHNHLLTVSSMLHNREYKEACLYIDDYTHTVAQNHYIISSGNVAIDSIVTAKILVAKENTIQTDYVIHLSKNIPISDMEMCSLIANLFDNAIEACLKTDDIQKRYIHLHIRPFNNMLCITMENYSTGRYSKDKYGNLATNKSNHSYINHGLGLQRINDIVNRCGGFIELCPDENKFTVTIMLPTNENQEITQ